MRKLFHPEVAAEYSLFARKMKLSFSSLKGLNEVINGESTIIFIIPFVI